MKIGFDAKRAFFNSAGLGNYSRDLITGLIQEFPDNDFYLFSPKAPTEKQLDFLEHQFNYSVKLPSGIGKFFKSYSRTMLMEKEIRKNDIDIYHGLSNEIPRRKQKDSKTKYVCTIHDLLFLRFPKYYTSVDAKIYERKFRYACEYSDKIIAISEKTKEDIIHFFRTDPKKIEVVYQSCHPVFEKEADETKKANVRKKFGLPENFILNVGTVEERKCLGVLVDALSKTLSDLPLIVVGKKKKYYEVVKALIESQGIEDRVIFLENVDLHELATIYQMADLFVYPSEFEGFGIPVLEAMYSGTPVITTRNSSMQEIAGDCAKYAEANDSADLAHTLDQVLKDKILQREMQIAGKERANHFSPKKHVTEVMNIYKGLG